MEWNKSFYRFPRSGFMPLTYIIGHYNPSVSIIDLVYHTSYVVCIYFRHKWRNLQFKIDPFHGNSIYSHNFCRNLLRGNRRKNTFCILLWCLAWGSNPGFTSNKPTHYSLDYGDFMPLRYLKTLKGEKGQYFI